LLLLLLLSLLYNPLTFFDPYQEKADDVLPEVAGALPAPAVKMNSSYHVYSRNLRVNIVVKNKGNDTASNIRLEIPLLAELESPYQELAKETFSHEPVEVKRLSNNNRVAVFQLDSLLPGVYLSIENSPIF
jgi:hypothetical protein